MPAIATVRYTHDAIIDEILMNPAISQGEISRLFGYTQAWVSIIVNSDAFKERLAERKGELIDPKITATLEARAETVSKLALDRLMEEIERPGPKKIMDLVSAAKLGLGDRMVKNPNVQNNNLYVVHLPSPAASTNGWLESAQGRPKAEVIDISHSNPEP